MCDENVMEALGNGQADNLKMQGLGIKNCMEMLDSIKRQLQEIPTRSEVREMIHDSLRIHVETCDAARDDTPAPPPTPPESNKFSLGKGGITAEGRAGVILGATVGIVACWLIFKVAPYIGAWMGVLGSKGG